MNIRRTLLRWVYPIFRKISGRKKVLLNSHSAVAFLPFHSLGATSIDGNPVAFSEFAGKYVLIVNTASDCGFTGQYGALQMLYKKYKDTLVIVGFPSNDFRQQEKGDNGAIAQFCKVNYGVSFPMMEKAGVLPGAGQHPVYQWLTSKEMNGWNEQAPEWNFAKYLVDAQGNLAGYFAPAVSPSEIAKLL
jgi:glutathione peroxidase